MDYNIENWIVETKYVEKKKYILQCYKPKNQWVVQVPDNSMPGNFAPKWFPSEDAARNFFGNL